MNSKRLGAAVLSLVSLTVVAACGSSSDAGSGHHMSMMSTTSPRSTSPAPAAASFNDADVRFATQMIPHHEQAVQMSKLAASRASSDQVKQLAAQIEKAQAPEIDQMSTWLRDWGKPVPTTMGGHDMSSMMPGMMSAQDMADLMVATGAQFDRMFLTMMIAHHEGAVQMARTEIAQGKNPEVKKLAQQIVTSQTTEIATMKTMLG